VITFEQIYAGRRWYFAAHAISFILQPHVSVTSDHHKHFGASNRSNDDQWQCHSFGRATVKMVQRHPTVSGFCWSTFRYSPCFLLIGHQTKSSSGPALRGSRKIQPISTASCPRFQSSSTSNHDSRIEKRPPALQG
jgi:hypothetical protein